MGIHLWVRLSHRVHQQSIDRWMDGWIDLWPDTDGYSIAWYELCVAKRVFHDIDK